MLNKFLPNINLNKLQYDNEGLYSITHYKDANYISEIIINNFNNNKNLKIIDGTGGLGGNTISFAKYFNNVTSIELDQTRCNMLKNNIKLYNLNNVNIINDDSIQFIMKYNKEYDIYFFDPPWGGPSYKDKQKIRLKMSNYKLSELPKIIDLNNKLLIFKLPLNYDLDEFSNYNYKLYKINKYYIIILLL
jgi:16S rRNA G966 N2-methylase RsmD